MQPGNGFLCLKDHLPKLPSSLDLSIPASTMASSSNFSNLSSPTSTDPNTQGKATDKNTHNLDSSTIPVDKKPCDSPLSPFGNYNQNNGVKVPPTNSNLPAPIFGGGQISSAGFDFTAPAFGNNPIRSGGFKSAEAPAQATTLAHGAKGDQATSHPSTMVFGGAQGAPAGSDSPAPIFGGGQISSAGFNFTAPSFSRGPIRPRELKSTAATAQAITPAQAITLAPVVTRVSTITPTPTVAAAVPVVSTTPQITPTARSALFGLFSRPVKAAVNRKQRLRSASRNVEENRAKMQRPYTSRPARSRSAIATKPTVTAPVNAPTQPTVAFYEISPAQPSDFDSAKAVTTDGIPAATTTASVSATSGSATTSSDAPHSALMAKLMDVEATMKKQFDKVLSKSRARATANASRNSIPEPDPAPATNTDTDNNPLETSLDTLDQGGETFGVGVQASSPIPLLSVPAELPNTQEAWESELERLIEYGFISKDLIDNISRGDEWFDGWAYHNKLQDYTGTEPLPANSILEDKVANTDALWLRNRKKVVYEHFMAIRGTAYNHWKKSHNIEQNQTLLETPVGKRQPSPIKTQHTKTQPAQIPRRKKQKKAGSKSKHVSDSSSSNPSPPPEVSASTEPFWNPNAEEESVPEVVIPEVPDKIQNSPRNEDSERFYAVYSELRIQGYSSVEVHNAIQYARKGPEDCEIPTVGACEAWINSGMIVPQRPDDWMFAAKGPSSPEMSPAPPAWDYVLRRGPLLHEDFRHVLAEEEAGKCKAEEAKRAEEAKKAEIVAKLARRPLSFEYKRLPDNGPTTVYHHTYLMERSIERLDLQYQDLTDIERRRGKTAALPGLETLEILAPRECRRLDDPKIIDAYIQNLRKEYEKVRMSKNPRPLEIQPGEVQDAEDSCRGPCDAFTKAFVAGAVGAAAVAGVSAAVYGACHR
ncbi:hypothetical protein BZA77DRAFT_295113 [Pyronema omphalodes]|nr:hypothetical protein BZA77DRAFT_295113 [Pyronema omphalodes]